MLIIWCLVVVLVGGFAWVNAWMLKVGAVSAAQVSQVCDEAAVTLLFLIALTLAFGFVAINERLKTK